MSDIIPTTPEETGEDRIANKLSRRGKVRLTEEPKDKPKVPGIAGRTRTAQDDLLELETAPKEVKRKGRPGMAETERFTFSIPKYLHRHLKIKAAQEGVTSRHLVLKALQDAGYPLEDVDNPPDGNKLPKR
ncbi:hypothetical protein ACGYLI_16750 [Sulfitobacter sp. 1A13421]|uniref:hypothetical protein n=1 Tax=Sulfitobacter sp. 1A13421 TaxID=3368595 RepID=UPI00374733E3